MLHNVNISTRLMILTGTLLTALAVVGLVALRGLSASNESMRTIYEDSTVPLVSLGEVLGDMYRSRTLVIGGMGAENSEAAELSYREVVTVNAKLKASLNSYKRSLQSSDAKAQADVFETAWEQYAAAGDKVIALAKSGDYEAASAQLKVDSEKKFEAARSALLTRMVRQKGEAQAAFAAADKSSATTRTLMLATLGLGLVLGAFLSYIVIDSIKKPLRRAVEVANRVATGDLSEHIEVTSTDETGQLLAALRDMDASLEKTIGKVREGSDRIVTASLEIARGNMDLSGRTEQQASSIEETSASIMELTDTVRRNGDNARQANQLALSASEVAEKGGAVVSEVVSTMRSINTSSRRIVDIISVIDGIAFQTNILALNAAVEAARAGEQGRGFAVVASEVRNLAQRSAAAAKEIKTLIEDSVDMVEAGTRLVDQAGTTMNNVVASVQKVTDIMKDIVSASQEQTAGIEQINQAIIEMDQVTQQNAALVEQAAAAAQSMQEDAAALAQVAQAFKLSAIAAPPVAGRGVLTLAR
ncbi:methyl-accepting chemotaxis protein [Massilia sp. CCM 8734]|uniref:methyl-accepting chemotaxis protein n=1 Tax=Massilia sp. CCM 8734 TaxID=2609283 RepID=UPI0014209398|nr:methyl-accepting chemotaxis protein [Massilia sp. CCM 8734]NHZ94233.1 HAMP domain-containing protein [Massilia sp. CCM 8734]